MVEPLSGLVEGEMAEVVWIISEADVREMLGRSGFLYGGGPDLSVKKSRPAAVYIQNTQAGGGYTGGIYKRNTCTADAMKIDDCETTIAYFLSGS